VKNASTWRPLGIAKLRERKKFHSDSLFDCKEPEYGLVTDFLLLPSFNLKPNPISVRHQHRFAGGCSLLSRRVCMTRAQRLAGGRKEARAAGNCAAAPDSALFR
jgi:hypothetical protein